MRITRNWLLGASAVMLTLCFAYFATTGMKTSPHESDAAAEEEEESKPRKATPLSEEDRLILSKAIETRGLDTKKISARYSLGDVEVREVYNSDFVWTKEKLSDALMGDDLYFIPLPRLDFVKKQTGEVFAQFRVDELNSNCESSISLANVDSSTPWPEILYFCLSNGSGATADLFTLSVTPDHRVLVNKQFAMFNYPLVLTGPIEVQPVQKAEKHLKSSYHSEVFIVDRKTGRSLNKKSDAKNPSFFAFPLRGSNSLWVCEQCIKRPFSIVSLENGVWKDANNEPGSRKWFVNSLKFVNANLKKFRTDKFKKDEIDFKLQTLNELLFVKLAHSIRIGKAAEAWKEINENFNKSVYRGCSGKEEDCPNPDWRVQLKEELEERGFETKDLKI